MDYNEDPKDAVLRELKEECNLIGKNPRVVKIKFFIFLKIVYFKK